jgi:hypothetical protein
MNTFSTASTRPRVSLGVTSGTSVARMNTLIASAPESTSNATNATAKLVVIPSRIVNTPNTATAASKLRAHLSGHRLPREEDGDERGADSRRGPQPAEPDRAHAEPLFRDRGEQCHCTAEQHREEVE